MNKIAYAVIGAGYGDEGKGLMTDYLVRKFTTDRPPVNVRFNGGGQAGHTVVSEQGRHVFSHVGAGSFAGASTYLSSNFIVNPLIMKRELGELAKMNIFPRTEVHPSCAVTTIFDIVLNALRELSRGNNRHGSCGVGINETVTRGCAGYRINVEDIYSPGFEQQMEDIMFNWWLPRFMQIPKNEIFAAGPEASEAYTKYMALWDMGTAIKSLQDNASCLLGQRHAPGNYGRHDAFIFEGAQGLELDEFMGAFPHVTRSQTGLQGALIAAANLGVTEITPVYVTRAYKTRHGAGPLPHEGMKFSKNKIVDKTNVKGDWQGEFRYAPLDIFKLHSIINTDMQLSIDLAEKLRIKINQPELAVTCLDQIGDEVVICHSDIYDSCETETVTHEQLIDLLNRIGRVRYLSYGETAKDIREI